MADMTPEPQGGRQMQPINAARLRQHEACGPMMQMFVEIFGEADAALIIVAAVMNKTHFDWDWVAKNHLSAKTRRAYDRAVAQHRQAFVMTEAKSRRVYEKAVAKSRRTHKEARVRHWGAHREAVAMHLQVYKEAMAQHRRAYEEAKARLFAELYLSARRGADR